MTQTLHFVAAAPRVDARREVGVAMRRGFLGRCPNCGEGKMFRAYLKVVDACPVCGEELVHQRADDAPAYVTMLLVGHFIIAGVIAAEAFTPDLPIAALGVAWSALAILGSLIVLPRVKGALVGYQWAMRMHGFGGPEKEYV
jgi:uncharacterized protein (DUF983 family)